MVLRLFMLLLVLFLCVLVQFVPALRPSVGFAVSLFVIGVLLFSAFCSVIYISLFIFVSVVIPSLFSIVLRFVHAFSF